jgi:hypothetical protein
MSDEWNRGARKRWFRLLRVETIRFSACLFVESPHHHHRRRSFVTHVIRKKSIAVCVLPRGMLRLRVLLLEASRERQFVRRFGYRWRDTLHQGSEIT